ncbi:MAG TPA: hypothetical protein VN038_13465, partial [Dyadobacter sp.]|nr:hypothetical protein [Dyadobacter sp.]
SAVNDNGNGGSLTFPQGPATPPQGTGSAQLGVNANNQGYMLYKSGYGALKLSDISVLSYKTYVQTGTNLIAPSMQVNIDRDTSDGDTSWQGRLVYEPYMSGTVTDGQWQTWNPLEGKWWLTKPDKFDNHCGQGDPCTVAQLTGYFANIGVNGGASAGVGFKAGSGWNSFVGNIDDVVINQDWYNFESVAAPALISPENNAIVNGATLVNKWGAVDGAVKYVYQSYNNAEMTNIRWTETTTHTQKSAKNVADGTTFWWRVKSIDASGTQGAWSNLWKVTIDNVAPVISTSITEGQTLSGVTNIDLNTVEAHPKVYNIRVLNTDGSAVVANGVAQGKYDENNTTNSFVYEWDTTKVANGTYKIEFSAQDAAGNNGTTIFRTISVNNPPVVEPPVPVIPTVSIDPDLTERMVTGLVSTDSASFAVEIDGVPRTISVAITGAAGDKFAWSFELPENVASGMAHNVKVTVTKDGQSSADEETFFIPEVIGGGITAPTGSTGSDPLLEQLRAALAQPFIVPNAFAYVAPTTAGGQTGDSDTAVLGTKTTKDPATDQNAKTVAVAATEGGWKLFGILWYWWLLLLAVLGYLSYRIMVKRRAEAQ